MQITKQDLEEQREQIQNDLQCVLDGLDEELIDAVCQVIVDRGPNELALMSECTRLDNAIKRLERLVPFETS